jgi:hypothetical protein
VGPSLVVTNGKAVLVVTTFIAAAGSTASASVTRPWQLLLL